MRFLPRAFRALTLDEKIAQELSEAKIGRLSAASQAEYYDALEVMYATRVARLEEEQRNIAKESSHGP